MERLKDRVWIWGHPTNCLKGHHGLIKESNVSPVQGMKELNARNIFYIPNGPGSWDLNKEQSTAKRNELCVEFQKECNNFGFAMRYDDTANDFIELKKNFPSLKRVIFDDFFQLDNNSNNVSIHSKEKIIDFKKKLNEVGIEVWVVYYERDLDWDITPYLDCFDGLSYWFWSQPTKEQYETDIKKFIKNTPNKKRLIGCYLYNFGKKCSCDADETERELNRNFELVKTEQIEGFILHTNAVGGMGFEGYERAKQWMNNNGDKEI